MKKVLYTMLALAMATFSMTSCEDVPAPYETPSAGGGQGGTTETVEPTGSGTIADPYNVAAIQQEGAKLSSGETSTDKYYFKGIVSYIKEEFTTTYGNGTFYISDDGTRTSEFYIYRAYYLDNKKFTSSDTQIEVGDTVVICGQLTNYNGTLETVQNGAYIYSLNSTGSSTGGDTGTASGEGTLANPYNVAAALQYTSALASNEQSDKDIYIKGIVTSITEEYSTTYGNATFYISDDTSASNKFYVFRTLYLGNVKYESGDQPKVGDEVIICGKVTNYYGNTPETVANLSYLYSLNGKTSTESGGSTSSAEGDGTLANPFNAVAANEYVAKLDADVSSDKDIYIKGKVASIKENYSTTYGNATFYISDDGTSDNTFYVFRTLYLGNVKYTEGTLPQVGDDVVICGKVVNYKGNTPETVQNQSYLYSLTSNNGGNTGGEVSGNSITFTPSSLGLDNGTAVTTVELSDGTTLTFDGGSNTNAPKYYTNGTNVRMYPKNSVTIASSKTISSVVFACDTYNNVICNASGDVTASPGTVSTSGSDLSVTGISSKNCTITNVSGTTGAASQIRFVSITITYAE